MGCCDSSAQLGRDGGIFRAGTGVAEVDSAWREGSGLGSAFEEFEEEISAAEDALICESYVVAKAATHKEFRIVTRSSESEAVLRWSARPNAGTARVGVDVGENRPAARDTIDICDNRIMDSPATRQGSAARWLLLLFVRFYQIFFSPFLGGACKFYPSCSRYAQEAIALHGARHGAWLAMKRLGRCRPFTKGGFDPVPEPDVANGASARATTYRALEYSDADWLRTASKERGQ